MKSRRKAIQLLALIVVMMIGGLIPYETIVYKTEENKSLSGDHLIAGLGELPRVLPYCIDEDSDFVDFGFPGSGTPDDPYVIEGVEILTNDSVIRCIDIKGNVTSWVTVRNCRLLGVGGGVFASYANISVDGCEISGAEHYDIYLSRCNANITNNYLSSSWMALQSYYCNGLQVNDNVITNSDRGLFLIHSNDSVITSNTVYNCTMGIEINGNGNLITKNIIFNSSRTGLRWYQNNNNRAYYNIFYQNYLNAEDMGTGGTRLLGNGTIITLENWWDDNVSMGNFWDNCIMGEPYSTERYGLNGVDNYPILYELDLPEIDNLDTYDIYPEDNTTLVWNATDDTPSMYEAYLDGAIITSDTWDGSPVRIDLSDVEVGEYNLTLFLLDLNGNSATDSAVLTVHESIISDSSETPTLMTETLVLVGAGTVVVAIVVVGAIALKKRP